MFKWFKIVKNQYLGCWLIGVLLFLIQEIPYIVMSLVHLKSNPIMEMSTNLVFLDICEKIFGVLSIIFMILIVNKDNKLFTVKTKKEITFFSIAVGIIFLNFVGWVLYFCGFQSAVMMIIFMFALPPLYYLFIGLWRKNYFLIVVSIMFFIVHLTNSFINLL